MAMTDRDLENAGLAQVGERALCKREAAGSNPAPGTTGDAFALIAQAVQAGQVDVGVIERLCALQERVQAQTAKASFIEAKARFQAECPIIAKTKPVYDKHGKLRYKYTPIEDIVKVAGPIIARCGFEYSFETYVRDGQFTAICHIQHIDGHSESSPFSIPVGHEEYMTEAQKHGARSTFAKRNAFINALGITLGGEDTDGAGTDSKMNEADYSRHCDAIDASADFAALSKAVEDAKNAAGIAGDKIAFNMFRQRGAARLRELPKETK